MFSVQGPMPSRIGSVMARSRVSAWISLSIADSPNSGYAECAIRPDAVNSMRIFGGRNKMRHRIHVRRKHGCRMRMFRMAREHVEAIALDRRFLHLVAQPA